MRTGLMLAAIAVALIAWWRAPAMIKGAPLAAPQDDYLVLAISWTPSWCAAEGDARGAARCDTGAGWLVHGLWPQHATGGWPEFCETPARAPSRSDSATMVDIMGDSGLAFYQWRKHGSCSGLDGAQYYGAIRAAFDALDLPRPAAGPLPPSGLLEDLRARNPAIPEDGASVTCRDGTVQELRVCLTPDLRPRACDAATLDRACRSGRVSLPSPR